MPARPSLGGLAALALAASAPAHGEPGWRLGIDVHGTDEAIAARRPLGLAVGIRSGATEAAVVIDPMLLILGWEMLDATLGRWIAGDRIELIAGWRQTSGRLNAGRRYDEALLLGGDVTALTSRWFRIAFGAELATSLWRHGGGLPDNTIALPPDAEIATRIELVLHLRFDITGAL